MEALTAYHEFEKIIEDHLHYKTIFCHNIALDV